MKNMEFTLYYKGSLKANGRKKHKHSIRQYFHPQLKELWEQPPLNKFMNFLDPNDKLSVIREICNFDFAPLVTKSSQLIAELDIFLLRPQPPGSIVTQGGDIDNRIKTLLDALKVPSSNELPKGTDPKDSEHPFFCLMEDDNLITKISINTDRFLEPMSETSEVVLFIHVKIKQIRVPWSAWG